VAGADATVPSVPRQVNASGREAEKRMAAGVSAGHRPRADPHQDDERRGTRRKRLQHRSVSVLGVARDDGEGGGEPAVGHRDPAQLGCRDGRRNAGHDLARHARRGERQRFLASAPEHDRIAALQAHDPLAAERTADHDALDRFLLDGVTSGALAHVSPARLRSMPERGAIDQGVVEHEVRGAETVDGAEGQQLRVAGPRADQ
jgi:hypothetical protein